MTTTDRSAPGPQAPTGEGRAGRRGDRVGRIVLLFYGGLALYLLGFLTGFKDLPPGETLKRAWQLSEDVVLYWRNDFGIEPTRLLVPADDPARVRVAALDEARMAEGLRLVSGLSPDKDSLYGVTLLDRAGAEVHFWPVDYGRLAEGGNANRVFLHGMVPLPDGSIVVNFDEGEAIARIGPCGETVWATAGLFHHGIDRSHDGTLWSWEREEGEWREFIVQLDPATGSRLRTISLVDDVVNRHALFGRFALHSSEKSDEVDWGFDPFHPNDVDVLSPELARAFPMFEAGDLLISLRSLNMVAVLDPGTAEVKWSKIGPWHRQHDPSFLPDGRISVYDNRMGVGASRIVRVDPATRKTETVFGGEAQGDFYSWRRGRHQTLENGHVVIVESEKGRVIEVDGDGREVWRFENVFDATRNGLVNEALVLPADFFAEGAFEGCVLSQ